MQEYSETNLFAQAICRMYPCASFLDNENKLWKFVSGNWVWEFAVKDPNHKGHRYIWASEIVQQHE